MQFLLAAADGTIWNALRYRVAAPSIRIVPWAALASCWPLPQQLLPVSAAGGGRRRCTLGIFSGKNILNFGFQESLRTFLKPIFTGGVVTENGICSAAFCESAALRLASSPSQALTRQIPPFVTCGDIFPRSGGSLSSKGEPLAVHANFISLPRPLPLGEVDANVVSRRRGRGCFSAAPPLPQEAGAANAACHYDPTRENGIAERPQTLRYPEN